MKLDLVLYENSFYRPSSIVNSNLPFVPVWYINGLGCLIYFSLYFSFINFYTIKILNVFFTLTLFSISSSSY